MNRLDQKKKLSIRRANRVRTAIRGTSQRPRLSVNISAHHVSAQIINDEQHVTLTAISSVGQKMSGTMTEKAEWAGAEIAKKATALKVKKVTLDRGSKLYHGRIKAFADSARKNGLEF